MALYWPEAGMAFEFTDEMGDELGKLPAEVLVLRVGRRQIESEGFLDGVRQIVIERMEESLGNDPQGRGDEPDPAALDPHEEELARDFFRALYGECPEDDARTDDLSVDELLRALDLEDDSLGGGRRPVSLVFNNCSGLNVTC